MSTLCFISLGGDQAQYVALSHCWGGAQLLATTTVTLGKRKEGIPMASLPKTFYDAVITTRKLGFDYLWIDSLCIIQDSTEDWAQESANMAAVYSGATVVIAADAAQDSTDGCFGPFVQAPRRNLSVAIPCINDEGLTCKVYAREAHFRNSHYQCEHGPRQNVPPLPLSLRDWVRKPHYNMFIVSMLLVDFGIVLTICSMCFRQHLNSLFCNIRDSLYLELSTDLLCSFQGFAREIASS
jgi:hypothetical protein